jgi:hypothetical protein
MRGLEDCRIEELQFPRTLLLCFSALKETFGSAIQ